LSRTSWSPEERETARRQWDDKAAALQAIVDQAGRPTLVPPIIIQFGLGVDLQCELNDLKLEIAGAGLLLRSVIAPDDAIQHFEENAPRFLAALKAWLVRNGQEGEL
jgi:hypothetical protein